MATPLEIEIALHYYARTADYGRGCGDNNFDAPAVQEALGRYVDMGLLLRRADAKPEYVRTDGLEAYVEHLTSQPFPRRVWRTGD